MLSLSGETNICLISLKFLGLPLESRYLDDLLTTDVYFEQMLNQIYPPTGL